MQTIQMLEPEDKPLTSDWCRPLVVIGEPAGATINTFSGRPINNLKWVYFGLAFGKYWDGVTVGELNKRVGPHEFIRGEIPLSHKLIGVAE